MRVCQEKYDGFKKFCHELLPHNPFVIMLQHLPLETFTHAIRIRSDQLGNEEEIVHKIYHKMDVDESQFAPEIVDKFRNYVRYFIKISKVISGCNPDLR